MINHSNTVSIARLAAIAALSAVTACRTGTPEQQRATAAETTATVASVPLPPPSVVTRPTLSAPSPKEESYPKPSARVLDTLSVGALLDHPVASGTRIIVAGECLDQFHARGSAGSPPVTRSDWQLAEGSRVIYVVGPFPATCASRRLVLSAIVDVDTIEVRGSRLPRMYLVIPR